MFMRVVSKTSWLPALAAILLICTNARSEDEVRATGAISGGGTFVSGNNPGAMFRADLGLISTEGGVAIKIGSVAIGVSACAVCQPLHPGATMATATTTSARDRWVENF